MLKVKVVKSDGMLNIEEYVLTYPYNLSSNNDNDAHYNLNSFEYKNVKGSFRLMFCKKMDFSGFKFNGEKMLKMVRLQIFKIHIQKILQPYKSFYLHKDCCFFRKDYC